MSDSAGEMRVGLNTKSGFRRFLHAREYHKFADGAYQHVKVVFACDLSYHVPYYLLHSTYRTESMTDPSFSPNRVHHRKLVGFACTHSICEPDSVYGLEDIYRTARSLYRCRLSYEEAFPSHLTQKRWVVDAWNEACLRTDAHPPNLLRQDEEARFFFCHKWHCFTRIFRLNATA